MMQRPLKRIFRRVRPALPLALALALCSTAPLAGGEDFETSTSLSAKTILPGELLRSEHHSVVDKVHNDGYLNFYRINSDFGEFEAYGTELLAVRVHEIHALVQLDELSKTEVFIDAAKEAGLSQIQTIAEFASHPVETVKGIPGGVSRKFKRYKKQAGEYLDKTREKRHQDEDDGETSAEESKSENEPTTKDKAVDAAEEYAGKWFGVTSAQRRWAAKLEVDPYGTNEVLRKAIEQVARVDAAAGLGMRLVVPGIPGVRYLRKANQLVWETDPYDLKILNEKQLLALGMEQSLLERFFTNPWHSPTSQTMIVQAVVEMPGVENRVELIAEAAKIESGEESRFFTRNVMILAWHHQKKTPLARILDSTASLSALTRQGQVLAVAATDHLLWTEAVAARARMIGEQTRAQGKSTSELYLLGSCSNRCRHEMTALGIQVLDNNQERFAAP